MSDLTPDQIRRMKMAVAIVEAQLNDDAAKVDALFKAGGSDLSPFIDGTFELAIGLATLLAGFRAQTIRATLEGLTPVEVTIVPDVGVNWDVGIAMVEAVRTGNSKTVEIGSQVDVPTALQTSFSIVVALLFELDGVQGRDTAFWLQTVASWLIAGAPAAPQGWEPPPPL